MSKINNTILKNKIFDKQIYIPLIKISRTKFPINNILFIFVFLSSLNNQINIIDYKIHSKYFINTK